MPRCFLAKKTSTFSEQRKWTLEEGPGQLTAGAVDDDDVTGLKYASVNDQVSVGEFPGTKTTGILKGEPRARHQHASKEVLPYSSSRNQAKQDSDHKVHLNRILSEQSSNSYNKLAAGQTVVNSPTRCSASAGCIEKSNKAGEKTAVPVNWQSPYRNHKLPVTPVVGHYSYSSHKLPLQQLTEFTSYGKQGVASKEHPVVSRKPSSQLHIRKDDDEKAVIDQTDDQQMDYCDQKTQSLQLKHSAAQPGGSVEHKQTWCTWITTQPRSDTSSQTLLSPRSLDEERSPDCDVEAKLEDCASPPSTPDSMSSSPASPLESRQKNILPGEVVVPGFENKGDIGVFTHRTKEETEAAHDLLQLSRSLPPLSAPQTVSNIHPSHSPSMQAMFPVSPPVTAPPAPLTVHTAAVNAPPTAHMLVDSPPTPPSSDEANYATYIYIAPHRPPEYRLPLTPPISESVGDLSHFSLVPKLHSDVYSKSLGSKKREMKLPIADGRAKKSVEAGERPKYSCNECGKDYATSSNLSRHKQTHRSLDSGSAKQCKICNKLYVSMPALSMHILTHNLNHRCDVCGKAFSRPWLLQGHKRSHTGDKPYSCTICVKSFADRSNLRAHMQTHSPAKNFKCNSCEKTFALKSYLNKHQESVCTKGSAVR